MVSSKQKRREGFENLSKLLFFKKSLLKTKYDAFVDLFFQQTTTQPFHGKAQRILAFRLKQRILSPFFNPGTFVFRIPGFRAIKHLTTGSSTVLLTLKIISRWLIVRRTHNFFSYLFIFCSAEVPASRLLFTTMKTLSDRAVIRDDKIIAEECFLKWQHPVLFKRMLRQFFSSFGLDKGNDGFHRNFCAAGCGIGPGSPSQETRSYCWRFWNRARACAVPGITGILWISLLWRFAGIKMSTTLCNLIFQISKARLSQRNGF